MKTEEAVFGVQQHRVKRYFFWNHIFAIIVVGIWFFGLGLIAAVIYAVSLGQWLPRKQAEALRYWLDGTTLRVDQGVFFYQRKAIPLDRVTDIVMVQGPLLRFLRIWALRIQTAGAGGPRAEAVLYGLERPSKIRDELLAARDTAAKAS